MSERIYTTRRDLNRIMEQQRTAGDRAGFARGVRANVYRSIWGPALAGAVFGSAIGYAVALAAIGGAL